MSSTSLQPSVDGGPPEIVDHTFDGEWLSRRDPVHHGWHAGELQHSRGKLDLLPSEPFERHLLSRKTISCSF